MRILSGSIALFILAGFQSGKVSGQDNCGGAQPCRIIDYGDCQNNSCPSKSYQAAYTLYNECEDGLYICTICGCERA